MRSLPARILAILIAVSGMAFIVHNSNLETADRLEPQLAVAEDDIKTTESLENPPRLPHEQTYFSTSKSGAPFRPPQKEMTGKQSRPGAEPEARVKKLDESISRLNEHIRKLQKKVYQLRAERARLIREQKPGAKK